MATVQSQPVVKCAQCGHVLHEAASAPVGTRRPCPECESTARMFEVALSASLTVQSKLSLKGRKAGTRKPFVELVTGRDLFRLTNVWNNLVRRIDYARDYYFELITDPKTGAVLRFCEEALSKHRGRGSAKKARGKDVPTDV